MFSIRVLLTFITLLVRIQADSSPGNAPLDIHIGIVHSIWPANPVTSLIHGLLQHLKHNVNKQHKPYNSCLLLCDSRNRHRELLADFECDYGHPRGQPHLGHHTYHTL